MLGGVFCLTMRRFLTAILSCFGRFDVDQVGLMAFLAQLFYVSKTKFKLQTTNTVWVFRSRLSDVGFLTISPFCIVYSPPLVNNTILSKQYTYISNCSARKLMQQI